MTKALPIIGLLFTCQANAGGYLMLEAGASMADLNLENFEQAADAWRENPDSTSGSTSQEDQRAFWRVGGGYAIFPWLAVELAYVNLGEFQGELSLKGEGANDEEASLTAKEKVALSGFDVQAVGLLPLTRDVSLLGSAGLTYMKQDRSYQAEVTNFDSEPMTGSEDDSKREWVPSVGLGVKWQVSQQIALSGRYQRYFGAGETENLPSFDVDTLSLALGWSW